MNLKELEIGSKQTITLMITKIEQATARNTTVYQRLVVRDADGEEATILNWGDPVRLKTPAVINANVETSEYREAASYRLLNFQVEEKANVKDFFPQSRINATKCWNQLVTMSKSMRESLRIIVGEVLTANKDRFQHLPLSQSKSYARQNGVLEATCKLCRLTKSVADDVNMDKDLAIAGAMLYYIGSVETMDDAFNATADDTLIGLGVSSYAKMMEQVNKILFTQKEKAEKLKQEEIKMLGHLLLSRYKGIQTSFPEALVLRHLDQIVTETEIMENNISEIMPGTAVSVGGQKIYRKSSE